MDLVAAGTLRIELEGYGFRCTPAVGGELMQSCDLHNFMAPCLLLLLAERADHGYDLVARLRPLIDADGDAGAVYRTLRHLERDGMVSSHWLPANGAPARRSYQLTDTGRGQLRECVVDMRELRDTLDRFLFRQRALGGPTLRDKR